MSDCSDSQNQANFDALGPDGRPILPPDLLQNGPETVENELKTVESPRSLDLDPDSGVRLVVRVTPEAHQWAHRLARHCSLCLTDLIWQSLLRQADASAFYVRCPPRYPRELRSRKH